MFLLDRRKSTKTPKVKIVKKKVYQKIQTCKRQGLLKAEISRKLELDPRIVAKYYEMSEEDYAVYDYLEEKHGKLPGNEKTLRNYIKYLIYTNRQNIVTNIRNF